MFVKAESPCINHLQLPRAVLCCGGTAEVCLPKLFPFPTPENRTLQKNREILICYCLMITRTQGGVLNLIRNMWHMSYFFISIKLEPLLFNS